MDGFFKQVQMAFSNLQATDGVQVLLYRGTENGGLVAAFSLTNVLYVYTLLFWTLVCCDLYRVTHFLRRKNRLNKVVLKPIADMTQAAAALSANNLSNRINIAGTKNELKDLATVINGMLDRIERSYNSQKQFVSDASHELRTPIAVIQGYANMENAACRRGPVCRFSRKPGSAYPDRAAQARYSPAVYPSGSQLCRGFRGEGFCRRHPHGQWKNHA